MLNKQACNVDSVISACIVQGCNALHIYSFDGGTTMTITEVVFRVLSGALCIRAEQETVQSGTK
jgi:hypothetical protein